jgi:hypothetical protein
MGFIYTYLQGEAHKLSIGKTTPSIIVAKNIPARDPKQCGGMGMGIIM